MGSGTLSTVIYVSCRSSGLWLAGGECGICSVIKSQSDVSCTGLAFSENKVGIAVDLRFLFLLFPVKSHINKYALGKHS